MSISGGDQRQGFSAVFSSGSPSDSMDVVFRVMRHVIIDDEGHIVDVNAPRDDIGSDKDRHFAIPEIKHNLIPLILLQIRMHCVCVNMERA